MSNSYSKGFTLIELLVVVAIVGIISAIAVPQYSGYLTSSRATIAKNNLKNIYLHQNEYLSDNNSYYATGSGCSDSSEDINTNLFNGDNIVGDDYYNYCINQTGSDDFTARAQLKSDTDTEYTIDEQNNSNF